MKHDSCLNAFKQETPQFQGDRAIALRIDELRMAQTVPLAGHQKQHAHLCWARRLRATVIQALG